MKIYHTADWHIGKFVNGFSMLEDQKYILNQLIKDLALNKIDTLIISGDIYDRSIPPKEAVKLLDEVIYKIISELNTKILIIPGNHDSAQRISFANKLYCNNGLYIIGDFDKKLPKITLTDEHGPINFYLLPYFNPSQVNNLFYKDDDDIKLKTFNESFKTIIDYNKPYIDKSSRNVLVAHGFFGWLNKETNIFYDQITSPSELSVGGIDIIDIEPASCFDYIALGHLHSPQKVKNQFFRYSGSLLKYSIEESTQQKNNVIIDLKEKGNINFTLSSLPTLRDMRTIRGYIKDLCESEESIKLISDDYVFIELLDETAVYDAVPRLRKTFKNIMGVKMVNRFTQDNNINIDKIENKDFTTLFKDFYHNVSGKDLDSEKQNIVTNILSNIEY